MPDKDTVADTRRKIAVAYNRLLKRLYNRRLSVPGSGDKEAAANLPPVDEFTGAWTSDDAKAPAWLVAFERDGDMWSIGPTDGNHANRLLSTYNCKSQLQGILPRVIPVLKETTAGVPLFTRHPYWEWALAFVFPGLATFVETGSTAATIDLDPATGVLSSTINIKNGDKNSSKRYEQPYVTSALFGLVPLEDLWADDVPLTYQMATDLLVRYVNVTTEQPLKRKDSAEDEDAGDEVVA